MEKLTVIKVCPDPGCDAVFHYCPKNHTDQPIDDDEDITRKKQTYELIKDYALKYNWIKGA